MSKLLIHQYYQNLERVVQFGKSKNEQSIRTPFFNLLNEYARKLNYEIVAEVFVMGTKGAKVRPDGVVKNMWGLDVGLWESKDEKDDIENEITEKIKKGYPLTNILFEDSKMAILYQNGQEVGRVNMRDADKLHQLLTDFVNFKSEIIYKFESAIEKFKEDIPSIVETLRHKIIQDAPKNPLFVSEQQVFWELCKSEINPEITLSDIREMMIQHILTSDIFNKVFDDPEFHRHNTIAAELEKLINILFTYAERRNLLQSIQHYYQAIDIAASAIGDHNEKQKFLKVLYENFYKVYNPKAADRLGVVYTPNEIVSFMVKSTDFLLHKHFGKSLADEEVEILDPATGTGTFICEIIENAIPKHLLEQKFLHDLHANEVAILPYYIANLNIEYTYKQKMGKYVEFPNLCFVDTLDNVESLGYAGKQHDIFGLTSENTARIKRQNSKKISVIIGNPPYNANQLNENENNKNRVYKTIDQRIKDTYIRHSTAQKTKVYDMYARFYRWASDRLANQGVLAFITNRSFIDSRTFDGFRKCIQDEFSHCYIVDTKSDVRANPKIAGTTHNVFGIQTGVAMMFLVKKEKNRHSASCRIEYFALEEEKLKEEKLEFLKYTSFEDIEFQRITPDKNNNWINLAEESDWEELLAVCSKEAKLGKNEDENVLFELYSLGIVTSRDDWSYDFQKANLEKKAKFFLDFFEKEKERWKKSDKSEKINNFIQRDIKWTSELEDHLLKWTNLEETLVTLQKLPPNGKREKIKKVKKELERYTKLKFHKKDIIRVLYRPFVKKFLYFKRVYTHRIYQNEKIFGFRNEFENKVIYFSGTSSSKPFQCLMTNCLAGLDFLEKTQSLPLYRYDKAGNKCENISDWGLRSFQEHYQNQNISKEDIFYYTYAVLHNPEYRQKYALNLKREYPRIPFYNNFDKWAGWGQKLATLHIDYEEIKEYPLTIEVQSLPANSKEKTILKADKSNNCLLITDCCTLKNVPAEAWEYKLGNRSALEWVLDQFKDAKPSDATIAEHFNNYDFLDYKKEVIELLQKVCGVSVETMKILVEMQTN